MFASSMLFMSMPTEEEFGEMWKEVAALLF